MFGVFAIRRRAAFAYLFGAILLVGCADLRAAEPFQEKVVPFLNTYCVRCHNDNEKKGELDLKRFNSAEKLFEDFRQWEHVLTFLRKEEMPPAKAKQPPAEMRADVLATLEKVLLTEARKYPGVVPPRRLSNAEFDYSIHDLTGADIRPARSFPIDPASGEGFNNTGEALTMSPALFKKYYAAGELVADHALLTSTGLKFAPHSAVTFADRLGFKYPDLFGHVSVLAGGPLDQELQGPRAKGNPAGRERILKDTFGGDLDYCKAQSPLTLAENNAATVIGKTRVRVAVGDRDFTAELNRAYSDRLKKLKFDHEFIVVPGVAHETLPLLKGLGEANWDFYRAAFGKK